MKDDEIKKLFTDLQIPTVSEGFENRVITASLVGRKSNKQFWPKYIAAAAAVIIVASFAFSKPSIPDASREYASLIDENAVINEDDIYDDLIVAGNN